MMLNPEEFITLGEAIISDENYGLEARKRTAIGRIYYGIMHYIRVKEQLFHIDLEDFHTKLINAINDLDTKLGNHLQSLKSFRTDADYYLNKKPDINSFLKTYERVQKILDSRDVD